MPKATSLQIKALSGFWLLFVSVMALSENGCFIFPSHKAYLFMAPAKCKLVALSLHVSVYLMFFSYIHYASKHISLYNCFKGPFLGFQR